MTDDPIFESDEMDLRSIDPSWTAKDLLRQDGIFFLKDIVGILKTDPLKVKKHARDLEIKGRSPWEVMGTRKIWSHWMVRMKTFAPYFRKHLASKVKRVDPLWDANILINQKGRFLLTEVCGKVPFSTHQIRYQAKRNPRAKEEYGVWKDPDLNAFVVDMERFSAWIKKLWSGRWTDPGKKEHGDEQA